jgi:hypothetical protein
MVHFDLCYQRQLHTCRDFVAFHAISKQSCNTFISACNQNQELVTYFKVKETTT